MSPPADGAHDGAGSAGSERGGFDGGAPGGPGRAPLREDLHRIEADIKALGDTGRATWKAGRDAGKALRVLLSADISLARSAFGRTLAFTGVAIAFGASAWLLLMAALVSWLSLGLGWPWAASLLATGVLSTAIAGFGGWSASRYFEHTRLQATRRQLARLGIGELAGYLPDAGSGTSSREAADRVADTAEATTLKKGLGVDVTPP
jgi:hypothetical protein